MTSENHIYWAELKPTHQTFITHYLRTKNRRQAYKEAYPHVADGNSLRSAANRLYKQLSPYIDNLEQRATEMALEELMHDAKERIKTEVCSLQSRREKLAEMITGQMQVKRHIRLRDRIVEVYDDVSPAVLVRAIDLDSRLAANKYKERVDSPKPAIPAYVPPPPPKEPEPTLEELLKKYPYDDPYWRGKCIRVPAQDVERLGFDTLDDGAPYLKNNLTDEYHKLRIQREMDYLKEHQPAVYQDIINNPVKIRYEDEPEEEQPQTPPDPTVDDLWKQYLAADSNTRRLHPADRHAKEQWFRVIPRKQQLKLIELYRKTG